MNTPIERILYLIKEKGITKKKFSDDLNLGKDKLSEWTLGKTTSYTKHINEIADYFGVTTDYILCKNDRINYEDMDNSFLAGKDNLTEAEKEKLRDYMEFLISQRNKKNEKK